MSFQALAISVQRALLDEVTQNLAALTVGARDGVLRIRAYYFEQPTEDEVERLEVVLSEMVADFPDVTDCEAQTRLLSEGQLEVLDFWAFMRSGVGSGGS